MSRRARHRRLEGIGLGVRRPACARKGSARARRALAAATWTGAAARSTVDGHACARASTSATRTRGTPGAGLAELDGAGPRRRRHGPDRAEPEYRPGRVRATRSRSTSSAPSSPCTTACRRLRAKRRGRSSTFSGGGATVRSPDSTPTRPPRRRVVRLTENLAPTGVRDQRGRARASSRRACTTRRSPPGRSAAGADYYERTRATVEAGGVRARSRRGARCVPRCPKRRGASAASLISRPVGSLARAGVPGPPGERCGPRDAPPHRRPVLHRRWK